MRKPSRGRQTNRLGAQGAEKLWKKYTKEGLAGLLAYPYQGSNGKLTQGQQQQLHDELCKDQMQGLQQVCEYVEKKFRVHYTSRGMGYVFERLQVKKKTGRPVYYNKDEKGEKRFKKKGSRT